MPFVNSLGVSSVRSSPPKNSIVLEFKIGSKTPILNNFSGGDIVISANTEYTITLNTGSLSQYNAVDYLIIGGGGGGGGGGGSAYRNWQQFYSRSGAGGGGGGSGTRLSGTLTGTNSILNLKFTVGSGGSGGSGGGTEYEIPSGSNVSGQTNGNPGNNTVLIYNASTYTANGGNPGTYGTSPYYTAPDNWDYTNFAVGVGGTGQNNGINGTSILTSTAGGYGGAGGNGFNGIIEGGGGAQARGGWAQIPYDPVARYNDADPNFYGAGGSGGGGGGAWADSGVTYAGARGGSGSNGYVRLTFYRV